MQLFYEKCIEYKNIGNEKCLFHPIEINKDKFENIYVLQINGETIYMSQLLFPLISELSKTNWTNKDWQIVRL